MGRSQILLENEISIFKKLVKRPTFLVNGCSQKTQWTNTSRWHCTPNYHRLWKLNTGLQATISTLPPDSRTLVSKWNIKLALIWKEDFGPLGNSPVLLLLSPGKTPLTTTVACCNNCSSNDKIFSKKDPARRIAWKLIMSVSSISSQWAFIAFMRFYTCTVRQI